MLDSSPPRAGAEKWVVIVDHARWHIFDQIGALARRSGARAMRISSAPSTKFSRWLDRLVYNQSHYLGDEKWLVGLFADLDVVALHVTEAAASTLSDNVLAALPGPIAAEIVTSRRAADKFEFARRARASGLDVPRTLRCSEATAEEAVARLGLPLVVKTPVGASGEGVVVALDLPTLIDATIAFEGIVGAYFEEFCHGDQCSYSAIAGPRGTVQEMTYRASKPARQATSVPVVMETIDDPSLISLGRKVGKEFGLRGPFNLQTVRDPQGVHWAIDLNPRPFGPMLSFDRRTIDTAEGYLYAIGLSDAPPTTAIAPPGLVVRGFPYEAEDLAAHGRYIAALASFAGQAGASIATFGVRYVLFAAVSRLHRRVMGGRGSVTAIASTA